mmetsp:Transcript_50313/g.106946  ORF Transcript_50313/g.106946 Transcript_50313/m.106946 type:complete len:391 (-) Transcript_50313:100-1272(-)
MDAVPRPPAEARSETAAPRKGPPASDVVVVAVAGPGQDGRWANGKPTAKVPTPPSKDDPPAPPKLDVDAFGAQVDVNRLVMGSSVGTGGTAEVFRGTYDGQVVAIKQLFRHRKMNVKEEISFNREVTVLAQITHPNLVKFYGVAFKEQPFRIVTEFCEGGTCFDLIHNGSFKLKWPQRVKVCVDTAVGMNYLHSFTPMIIHRDLKSLNLLLESTVSTPSHVPVVKVSDFGLSRMKDPNTARWGKMTSQVGTLHWMAPEVFAGHEYDESVDIYSYAMVMFEALCQEVPFEDTDPGLIGKMTVKGVRPDLGRVPKDCPKQLKELMTSCWAHDPKQRPSFEKVVEYLYILGGTPPTKAPIPPGKSGGPPASNKVGEDRPELKASKSFGENVSL